MAKNIKVKINQAAWGRQVMSSASMEAHLARIGGQVGAKLPGCTVEVSSSRTIRGGGRRSRATITTDIPMSVEAETGQALAAVKSVVGSAKKPKRTKKYRAREAKRIARRG